MIRYKVFSFGDREPGVVYREALLPWKPPVPTPALVAKYKNTHEMYEAVAEFASGCDLVAISGSPYGLCSDDRFVHGEVVVWYKHRDEAVSITISSSEEHK